MLVGLSLLGFAAGLALAHGIRCARAAAITRATGIRWGPPATPAPPGPFYTADAPPPPAHDAQAWPLDRGCDD
ncbi:MAG: hypothetical protein NVSMB59_23180 [Vulcanimicrobiaceae bacterium]